MARKKDTGIKEDIDRGEENEQGSSGADRSNGFKNESDSIKNANAAGLGAIGRNDEKQTDDASTDSAAAENE